MDGTPDGKIKCTIGNWIGVVYKIPIKELDSCREREELKGLLQKSVESRLSTALFMFKD